MQRAFVFHSCKRVLSLELQFRHLTPHLKRTKVALGYLCNFYICSLYMHKRQLFAPAPFVIINRFFS